MREGARFLRPGIQDVAARLRGKVSMKAAPSHRKASALEGLSRSSCVTTER
jgi:hypothetical protein